MEAPIYNVRRSSGGVIESEPAGVQAVSHWMVEVIRWRQKREIARDLRIDTLAARIVRRNIEGLNDAAPAPTEKTRFRLRCEHETIRADVLAHTDPAVAREEEGTIPAQGPANCASEAVVDQLGPVGRWNRRIVEEFIRVQKRIAVEMIQRRVPAIRARS